MGGRGPLAEARFRAALDRVRTEQAARDASARVERLAALLKRFDACEPSAGELARPWLSVPTARGERLLEPSEIVWIEADDDHAWVYVAEGRYRVRATLVALERRLRPFGFARIHRATLVRLGSVRAWRAAAGGEAILELDRGRELAVSRRRWASVKRVLRARTP